MYIKQKQNGFVLILALVLLAVMTLIGVSSMTSSSMELRATANARQHHVAFNVGQSILEFALSGDTNLDFQTDVTTTKYIDTALLPQSIKDETLISAVSGESNYAGCAVAVGSSLEEGKGLSSNFFEITATASNASGSATSIQGQGLRFPAAACNDPEEEAPPPSAAP